MKLALRIFIIAILLTALTCIEGCAPRNSAFVRSYVDRRAIFIGDRIRYTIEVRTNKYTVVQFPKFDSEKIGDFEIKDTGSIVKKGIFGRRAFFNWYIITSYSPGKHLIPKFEVSYRKKSDAGWSKGQTGEVEIRVESVLPKDGKVTDIKEIKGPIYFSSINYLLITVVALIIFVCVLIEVKYRRRKRILPPRPPYDVALEELGEARDLLASSGDVKEYYQKVSDSIRKYIEDVFRLHAPEMTTVEFLNSLKESEGLAASHKDLLRDFLEACDMVKFAKYAPSRTETEDVFVTAKNFIEETKGLSSKIGSVAE
jgi:hypothetical protein